MSVRVAGANGSDIEKVEFVGPCNIFQYFHKMVDYFVDRGYVRDVSIRGAPYDWRFAAGNTIMHADKCMSLLPCLIYSNCMSWVYIEIPPGLTGEDTNSNLPAIETTRAGSESSDSNLPAIEIPSGLAL